MLPQSLLFFLVLALCSLPAFISHNSTRSDEEALLAFKNSLVLDPFDSLHNWNVSHSFCSWNGVVCTSRPQRAVRAVSLNLTGMALTGPISPFLGYLSFLRVLSLRNNGFYGHIPYELGGLSRLRILRLSQNELGGSIPSALANCSSLQRLVLAGNYLSGRIPPEFVLLSKLEIIYLGRNELTGTVPPFIGNMSSLIKLDLGENKLHGPIPFELTSLTQLIWLDLSHNNLKGEILNVLSNCTSLQVLSFSFNDFIGHIPWEFGTKLAQLQELYIAGNQLIGEIPSSLANCTQLQVLELCENQLSKTVPMELGMLSELTWLNLAVNELFAESNRFLAALINCSQLQFLGLEENSLSGFLASSIGQLSPVLSRLELYSNEIKGNIPDEICNLTNLTYIDFSQNSFNGTIPSGLNSISRLERLNLGENNLHGGIPSNLGQLKSLGLLNLGYNMLSGVIPDSLGQLPQLRDLYLHHNQFAGEIPVSLGTCLTMETLDLAYNKLTGNIPPELAGLQNLQFYFNLSNNLLQGSLPLDISKFQMVQAVDISANNLSGGIPSALASCVALLYLNFSWNSLEGPIPASLVNLKNLEDMDLSSNKLNGTIPIALEKFKMLQHLNLSSNKLTGEVPKHGIFARLDASAVMGNPGLCGTWIGLPACSHSKHRHHWLLKKVLLPIMSGTAFVIVCLLIILIWGRQKNMTPDASALKFGPTKISYKELIDATLGFSEANVLGIGSFGSVYRGILNNGTNIAVKVLNLQDENAYHSFSRECNVLKRVRHRNVIRIISACSTDDFKALILPFMPNGSLERWLRLAGEECKLNLCERLRIAIEVAQGMEYLHHDCFVQVLHCDLKPSNVLFGADMTVYLADFGISRLIFGNSMSSLSSTNALKGSIGYMAPEYGTGGQVWAKGDIYSYGILLLELLTRRRPTDDIFVEGMNLSKWVRINFQRNVTEVVDNNLLTDVNESYSSRVLECITQVLQVGLVCASESPQERPDMKEIVKRLDTVKHTFLGMPRAFKLPVDISSLLANTSGQNNTKLESDESWSTSTT